MDKKISYTGKIIDGKYIVANAELPSSSGVDERLFFFREGEGVEDYGVAKVVLGGGSGKWYTLIEGALEEDARVVYDSAKQKPDVLEELVGSRNVQEESPSMKGIEFVLHSLALSYQVKRGLPREVYWDFVKGILDYGRGNENGIIQSGKALSVLVKELVDAYEPPVEESKDPKIAKNNDDQEVAIQINKLGVTRYLIDYIEASRNGELLSDGSLDESNLFEFLEKWEDDVDETRDHYIEFIVPADEEEEGELGLELSLVKK